MPKFDVTQEMCRTEAELKAMDGTMPNRGDYQYLFDEEKEVRGPDGEVVALLVTECLDKRLIENSAVSMREVHGDLSNRGSIVYQGSMMNRERADKTLSFTKHVPPEILEALRKENERLGLTGPFSDFLGYYDKTVREPFCRETAWSLERSDIFEASRPLVAAVDQIYQEELPEHWKRQREFMDRVSPEFKYNNSVYSTVTVNLNVCSAYHTDANDFRGGMGNLVALELGDKHSGILVMAKFRIAFLVRPTDCLFMNVHEMHGNMPLTPGGERLTCVLYAREHLDECS